MQKALKLGLIALLPIGVIYGMSKINPTKSIHPSRGYRNNNPLNIRLTSIPWNGKVPIDENTDGTFEQFYDRKMGYRAAAKNILNYDKLYNIFTLERIINKWAPPVGKDPISGDPYNNHTKQYIDFVVAKTGMKPYELINGDNVGKLVWAMAQFENTPPHLDSLDYVNDATKEFRS